MDVKEINFFVDIRLYKSFHCENCNGGYIIKMGVSDKVRDAGLILGALGTIGVIGIVFLMIYGNLSGNLGFAVGTAGDNSTNAVIDNVTSGFQTFFGFSNTFFTIAAVVLLIFMLVGLLAIVMKIMQSGKGGRGFEGFS